MRPLLLTPDAQSLSSAAPAVADGEADAVEAAEAAEIRGMVVTPAPRVVGAASRADPATATGAFSRRLRRGSVLHPARLDLRAALQSLQPRNLLAQFRYHAFLLGILVQQLQRKLLQLGV